MICIIKKKIVVPSLLMCTSLIVYAQSINLRCEGIEQEWTSYSGKNQDIKRIKSYSIVDKKIGHINCSVWNEKKIYCYGGLRTEYVRNDGGMNYIGGISITLLFDRISGTIKETIEDRGVRSIETINPNPFGFDRTTKLQEEFKTINEFSGSCEKATKKF
jgi:hypothetical protein